MPPEVIFPWQPFKEFRVRRTGEDIHVGADRFFEEEEK
jgi:hypothetical protein